ncbi:microtubule-associated protein 10 [Syngnathus acus]|uniref:microtubule-associated protein 10 n=1 Tax=Syngnathus acus TaxID=161584 RepID=UPI00188603C8|nr:microtubule-associated protein 10 [Syngnathus acus]
MCRTHVATIMSQRPDENPKRETLFSFELLVEYIRINSEKEISDKLAVGIRLLDFPTLLIYPPELRGDNRNNHLQHEKDKRWVYSFNKGKSCFFEMNLDSLHRKLTNTPLYVMILDVKDEIPKLLGTSLISLASIINRIRHDSIEHDVASCSSFGERGSVCVNNLAEEPVGVISLSYKLLMVGDSLPPHVTKNIPVSGKQCAQEDILKKKANEKLRSGSMGVKFPTQDNSDDGWNNVEKKAVFTQTGHDPISQIPHTVQEHKNLDEDLTVFCPPCLYYCNSGKEKRKPQGSEYRLVQCESPVVSHKATFSDNESGNSLAMDQALQNEPNVSASVTPKGLEEALRPLPLLNALFLELSQLNVHNLHQPPLSNHPDLAGIYKTASPEASGRQWSAPKTRPEQESKVDTTSKHLHSPRIVSPQSMKAEPKESMQNNQFEALIDSKPHRKKLMYRTTKTYNLRRQKNCTVVKNRDCMALHTTNQTRLSASKGEKKVKSFIPKENMKTQKTKEVSVVEDTTKQKHEDRSKLESPKQELDTSSISLSCLDDDATSNQLPKMILTWTKSESQIMKLDSPKSSSHSSHKSVVSDSDKEEEYADDFNSFEASDADTSSSPESAKSKPSKPPFLTSDSDSEPVKEKTLLPAPIRGHSPVQRVLRGTHLIQPRTQDSALSFSSEDGSASMQMEYSKKQEKEEDAGVTSPRGLKSESSSLVWRGSSDSMCSDPLEAKELEDDLGSLDFRKEYQHISELAAVKLPGYTM